ncbi:MAG: hypothetical protein ACJAXX_001084 [Roseivirga sp.]|jgi:hypothetical protein
MPAADYEISNTQCCSAGKALIKELVICSLIKLRGCVAEISEFFSANALAQQRKRLNLGMTSALGFIKAIYLLKDSCLGNLSPKIIHV